MKPKFKLKDTVTYISDHDLHKAKIFSYTVDLFNDTPVYCIYLKHENRIIENIKESQLVKLTL